MRVVPHGSLLNPKRCFHLWHRPMMILRCQSLKILPSSRKQLQTTARLSRTINSRCSSCQPFCSAICRTTRLTVTAFSLSSPYLRMVSLPTASPCAKFKVSPWMTATKSVRTEQVWLLSISHSIWHLIVAKSNARLPPGSSADQLSDIMPNSAKISSYLTLLYKQ